MATYKLYYFDARSRGEPARMLFALKGQKYEDIRFKYGGEEWPKMKNDKSRFPFGQVPTLAVDGTVIPQSRAIYRYLARKFGYYGNNAEEDRDIDVLCEIATDIENEIAPLFDEEDAEKREAALIKSRDTNLNKFFEFLSDHIQKSDGIYLIGNRITLADLVVFNILDFFLDSVLVAKGYLDSYPVLLKYCKSIMDESQLTPYIKSRPYTMY
ncbi:glutathione S-transferase 1-like [Diadema setosum]|uniref:glutathione S-transferase 1-like n=1 Tax=Diadema setosum TaxID=31175 RepID=UPI003B3A50D1